MYREDGVWSPVNTLPGGVHHNGSGVRYDVIFTLLRTLLSHVHAGGCVPQAVHVESCYREWDTYLVTTSWWRHQIGQLTQVLHNPLIPPPPLTSHSGVMENRTYCDLSVQFLIELHGMPMGTVTALIVLIASGQYLACVQPLIALYLCSFGCLCCPY